MWYLKIAGFNVVPLKDVLYFIEGKSSGKKLVALTFDDGYHDFFENAYPVLRAYNFPSTVFVIADLIGKENVWDYKNAGIRKRLMDWKTIHQLKREGVTFGSHTRTHPFLGRLSPNALRDEIYNSKSKLEEQLQLPVDFFCYPYGDYDDTTIDVVKQAGYKSAVTTKRGLVHKGDNIFEIRRSFIRTHTNPFLFLGRLHSPYEDRRGMRK
jgi:peptidoglycan/xylan/chitin deacetylase (PgdA/CDA1 family)